MLISGVWVSEEGSGKTNMYRAQSLPQKDSLLMLELLDYPQIKGQIRTPIPRIEAQIKIKNISKTVNA